MQDMNEIKKLLEEKAKEVCARFGLSRVYFAQVLGRRNHFLAGHGEEMFVRPEKRTLTEKITVFWEGDISEEKRRALLDELIPFAKKVSKVL